MKDNRTAIINELKRVNAAVPLSNQRRSGNALGLLMCFVSAVIACCVLYVIASQVLSYGTLIPTFVEVAK